MNKNTICNTFTLQEFVINYFFTISNISTIFSSQYPKWQGAL